jgi:hypothetical protein
MWGDFGGQDAAPLRRPSEGPTGWIVAVGLLLLVVGLGAMLLGVLAEYGDLNGPNDVRMNDTVAFLWAPGAVVAVIGVALFAWGCWRKAHAD